MPNKHYLEFRKAIPLFQDLPDEMYSHLDLSGFYLPTGEIEKLRSELENKLDHYVISYKAEIFNLAVPADTHLCGLVKGAELNPLQLMLLKRYEALAKPYGVTFVVYQKPLTLIPIQDSILYQEYLKRGLL